MTIPILDALGFDVESEVKLNPTTYFYFSYW